MVAAMARYSASAEEREMVGYFLDFQETSESPKKMQKPVVDFLESVQDPQSASVKALICNGDKAEKKRP